MITFGRTALALILLILVASACGSSTPIDTATAPGLISKSYNTFFNMANGKVDAKVAVVQDGPALATAVSTAVHTPLALSAVGAVVSDVRQLPTSSCISEMVPSPCAKLSYQIVTGASGGPTSPPTGYATFGGGKWMVAKTTACPILALLYKVAKRSGRPPGCT